MIRQARCSRFKTRQIIRFFSKTLAKRSPEPYFSRIQALSTFWNISIQPISIKIHRYLTFGKTFFSYIPFNIFFKRNPKKLKVYDQKNDENNEKEAVSLKKLIFSKFSINRNKLLPLPNFYTSKFVEFFQGNEATKCPEHAENIKEILRKSLEESDLINGFQVLSDCDSGFGIYS